jgi:hypothetical protein
VRGLAHQLAQLGREQARRLGRVEAEEQPVEQLGLPLRRDARRVLDGVGDPAKQIGRAHGAPEVTRQNADAQGERARHRREHLQAEALGVLESDRSIENGAVAGVAAVGAHPSPRRRPS